MGNYHIKLDDDDDAQKLCTIGFLWGKYKYKRLPMGIENSNDPDIFQNAMVNHVQDMDYAKTYIDDLFILTNRDNRFKYHLLKLEIVLTRLSTAGMRLNISKSKFFAEQIEYLTIGY
jgi:hypothetical protein